MHFRNILSETEAHPKILVILRPTRRSALRICMLKYAHEIRDLLVVQGDHPSGGHVVRFRGRGHISKLTPSVARQREIDWFFSHFLQCKRP